ncbi:EscU/YscU/HrcU family type III secretion system export apparatus switch protein [Halioxenophilus sp. WMMB6]|uniref:EscU/YscU/HrcU family type III secretion system export apparatus switch protein n=1 Tax=Halioxenophilus sp. WMMB6 TaxID=3073815 RepID=UPI00295EB426|nr:EscU/YscU/HrcU family type III secretion system export apparatus switch protein [Halioxenophilus sp. WMMB6]
MANDHTNRTNQPKAAALTYTGSGAPRLTAKGTEEIAEQIIELAEEHEIPLFENPLLVEFLCQLELNDEIPGELYRTIAHILALAYRLEEIIPFRLQGD